MQEAPAFAGSGLREVGEGCVSEQPEGLLEVAPGTQQMPPHADEFLRFLQEVEIDERYIFVSLFLLYAVHLQFAQGGELLFQRIAVGQHLVGLGIVVLHEDVARLAHEGCQFVAQGDEFLGALLGQGVEVVVHVFLAGVAHTLEAVEHLLATVDAEVEPCVLLDGQALVDAAQADDFLAAGFLELVA